MDKLTWFKFTPSDWMMGKIQRCPADTRGMFMNLCCLYWNKECDLSAEDAEIEVDEEHFNTLLKKKIIVLDGENIRISFLDEQYDEIIQVSERNRKNGMKGGRPSKASKGKLNLYFVRLYSKNESFLKVGVTSSSVKRRMNNIPYSHESLFEIELSTNDALNLENMIHDRFEKYEPNLDFGGKLECIKDTSVNRMSIVNILQNPNKTQTEPTANPKKADKSKIREEGETEKKKEDIFLCSLSDETELANDYQRIAFSFWKLFKQNLNDSGISKTTSLDKAKLSSWENDIRLSFEQDGRSKQEFEVLWHFLKKSDFWKKNIQSTKKLRQQFERLFIEAAKERKKTDPHYERKRKLYERYHGSQQ